MNIYNLFLNQKTVIQKITLGLVGWVIGLPVFAQGFFGGGSFRDIALGFGRFLSGTIVPIIVGLALIYFLWNMIHYIANMSNEKEREQFKKYTINSIIGLFIITSLWGLLAIFTGIVFNNRPLIPQFPTGENNVQ
jgi:hypothetical protein